MIERLYSYGATYTGRASDCDVFIDYENANKEEARYLIVRNANEEGKNIRIVTFSEALRILEIKQEDLSKRDNLK